MRKMLCRTCGQKRTDPLSPRSLVISLPHLPPAELNPNRLRRLYWATRHRLAQAAREEIGWVAKAKWGNKPPMEHARISYEFYLDDKRLRDTDNLLAACKAWQDGLVDAGVLTADDCDHLEYGSVSVSRGDEAKTVIGIQEMSYKEERC